MRKSLVPLAPLVLLAAAFATASPAPPPAAAPSGRSDFPPSVAERSAGIERHDGFIPYFWDARRGILLLEIGRWNEDFLYGSGLASGAGLLEPTLDRGEIGSLGLCHFERVGPRALLVQKQTENRATNPDPEQARVVSESFPTSILAALPIVAETGDTVLADATEFLMRDNGVASALKSAKQGDWRADAMRGAFSFDRTGAFPRNTEIEAQLTVVSDDPPAAVASVLPDGHTMTLRLHHTFLKLPEPGFSPRPLDPRIGFIPLFYRDHTAPFNAPIERYLACRWRVDASHPIVYYLDRGIPEPERSAMKEAALWWNHAFAEAGLPGAFVLEDLPVGATFLDARYSGIEWVNRADRSWSFGEIQVDPRTGEIVHGVARIDSHRRFTTARMWRNFQVSPSPGDRVSSAAGNPLACAAADAPDASWLAASDPGDGGISEKELVLERLRYLVAHEVGHTLGLMHDWAATTFGWGSVMDYLAANVQLKDGRLDFSDAYPGDIGSYDRLMIRWGYSADANPARLDAIVREGYAHGNVYPLESDPRWAEYDWGADPVRWLATTQQVRRVILERFGSGQLAPGEPVYELQERFSLAYLYHRFGIQAAQQFVGGQLQTNALAGDGQKPVAWVSPALQREAIRLLLEALRPENLDIPDRVTAALVAAPQGESPTRERFPSEAGPTFSRATAARSLAGLVVAPLLDPERAARLTLDDEPGAPGLDELFHDLVAATWSAAPPRSSRLAVLARVARRVVLDAMMDLASSDRASPEVRGKTLLALTELRGRLAALRPADRAERADVLLARRDLAEFLDRPEARKDRHAPPAAPPGRPIGSPAR
jgi:hypothetical protein